MDVFEVERGPFVISTDPSRLDVPLICDWLSNVSYWAQGRARATVQRSIAHSLCFGIYQGEQQVGFARVVTDYATFAWICDVFVLETARGHGLGKWLIEVIVAHPALENLRWFLLKTRDAHELYRKYGGFEPLPDPEQWMVRVKPIHASGTRA